MRLFRLAAFFGLIVVPSSAVYAQTLPPGVQKVTSVEGIDEYAFPNGLHALLFPDNSKPKVTVNVVYRVGSRNEGYGETGMAHLLEHMCFKSTTTGRTLFSELTDRAGGGNFNGQTSYDQTIYFETVNASDENLRWALGLEADRMVNMTMLGKDLVTEMPVVRNEMESGENSPQNVLHERVLAAAYNFHNYGKTVIGNRTDVEHVPIENLAVFYKKYYQPDDADVVVAGQFDETKALALIAETLGKLPKPDRVLTQPYTMEPTQEGEREVVLRRVGSTQLVTVVYHTPAAMHSDSAPLEVLSEILGAQQTGRLYKALIDTKKATQAYFFDNGMHDPGYASAFAELKTDQSIDDVRQTMLKTVEGVAENPPTQEEVDRAKARLAKNFELTLANSQTVAIWLGFAVGDGDWRDLFLSRDEIASRGAARGQGISEVLEPHAGRVHSHGDAGPRGDSGHARRCGALQGLQGRRIGAGGRSFRSDTEEHRGARDSRNAAERHEAGDVPEEDARGDGERGGERVLWRREIAVRQIGCLGDGRRAAGARNQDEEQAADSGRSRPPEGAGERLRLVHWRFGQCEDGGGKSARGSQAGARTAARVYLP